MKQFKLKKIKFLNVNRKKKTTEVLNLFGERVTSSIGRTVIACFAVIGFFYVTPIFINFANQEIFSNEFQNDSRKIMVYKLNGKQEEINVDINEAFDEKDLLSDILTLNDLDTESVRLSASTISQLFRDTNYDLKDVRANKLVKPVALTWLPHEIKKIENTNKRKELFIQIVLPLILEENNNIKLDRLKLFTIINKNNNTKLEKQWLNQKYKQYGIPSKDLSTLKRDVPQPVSFAA